MESILSVKNLTKHYPGFALEGVSLDLIPGHIMGLIGKNGAGKSTLLKSMLNMVHPDGGSVTMFGRDFYKNEKACKEKLGIVFGGIDFYPLKKLSAITACYHRFYPGWEQEKYEKRLKVFGIDENKQFRSLSNGMKVKYLLALALSTGGEILILDEPTSGLDPVSRDEILQIFESVVSGGRRTILFSTHITSDLDRCAHDITYIKDGRVLKSADRETFLNSFDHLKEKGEKSLTLEEIMLRTERRQFDDEAVI